MESLVQFMSEQIQITLRIQFVYFALWSWYYLKLKIPKKAEKLEYKFPEMISKVQF